ncbi:DUF2512 family protein [Melghirimyces algeriensis]|nr:DUF2512 family protein [Melghirimyces algeriensis]
MDQKFYGRSESMRYFQILLIKFASIFLSLVVALGWVQNLNWIHLLVIGFLYSLVSYIVGEIILLPYVNNTILTLLDFVLSLMVITFVGNRLYGMDLTLINLSFFASAAIFIAVVEWVVHAYVQKNMLKRPL